MEHAGMAPSSVTAGVESGSGRPHFKQPEHCSALHCQALSCCLSCYCLWAL